MAKITGTAGADNNLTGGAGDDFIYGYEGNDRLEGGAGNDRLYAGAGNDTLLGGEGDDQLSGGEGADFMEGGVGNDTYYVDDRGDITREFATTSTYDGGIDTVVFQGFGPADAVGAGDTSSYRISSNIEVLRLFTTGDFSSAANLGDKNLNGSGNELSNRIIGNAGNNSLRGLEGNDDINGGAGNDIISGDQGNDTMNGGVGVDEVTYKFSTGGVTVSLATTAAQVIGGDQGTDRLVGFENLEGSNFADRLTGDASANKISGLGGSDTIIGGAGNDDLTGGADADLFVFSAPGDNGLDRIRGFTSGVDKLGFNPADFGGNPGFNLDEAIGTGPQGIYDTKTHILYYDADGVGAGQAIAIAQFDNTTTLTANDFQAL